jgi:hypothetical protein
MGNLWTTFKVYIQSDDPPSHMSVAHTDISPIRLISFEYFKRAKCIPRCPENRRSLTTLDRVDRSNSLIIYISHNWLRSHNGSLDWDGTPHPDNISAEKYKLCVEGTVVVHINSV